MFKWLKDWGNEVKDKFQAVVPGYFGGGWFTEGWLTTPGSGTILADTGPLTAGIYCVTICVASNGHLGGDHMVFQYRSAANDVTLKDQHFGVHSGQGSMPMFFLLKVSEGERFRALQLILPAANMQVSIFVTRQFPLHRGQ